MIPFAYDPGRDVFYAWTAEEAQYAFMAHNAKKVLCIDEPMCAIMSTVAEAHMFFNRPSISISIN